MTALLTQQHKDSFEENGYCIIRDVLSPSEVEYVRERAMALAKTEEESGSAHFYDEASKSQRVWNLLNKDPVFQKIIQTPVILEIMDWIFDRDTPHQKYYLSSFQAHILHPGTKKMKLHIDTPFPEPLPDWPTKANTIWILDDFDETHGATEFLPGSHKFKHKPKVEDQTREDLAVAQAPAGSVLVIHGALWHRGGTNTSNSSRTALLGSFAASYAREIANEENYSVVLNQEVYENASDELKAILGPDHGIRPGAKHAHMD
jgi:ectoine hydroxylase-related dioxygenase (phytanoyl-CoA dioxygenase family)